MDAELTWHVWRRILKDAQLSQQVRSCAVNLGEFGLTDEEAAVVLAYAAHPRGSGWAIETYRYRSVSSALHALAAGAPLTLRLLRRTGLDLRKLAEAFAEGRGWADDGPFIYHRCADFLRSLMVSEQCQHIQGLQDIAALELAVAHLMTQCARLPAETWPTAGHKLLPVNPAQGWYVQNGLGIALATTHRLTPWLRDSRLFGHSPLTQGPENLLLYLPDLDRQYALCVLSDDAVRVFQRVIAPCHYADLADDLSPGRQHGGDGKGKHQPTEVLADLVRLGVVHAATTRVEALQVARQRDGE